MWCRVTNRASRVQTHQNEFSPRKRLNYSRTTTKTCRQHEYNPSKTLTLRNSCTEIRELTRAYAELLEAAHDFERMNTQRFVPATFGTDLVEMTTAFDGFSQQAVSVFSTVRKTALTRQFGTSSLLYQRGAEFTRKWTSFIELVNDIGATGISGYEGEIRDSFGCLFGTLSFIEGRMQRKGYLEKDVVRFINGSRTQLRAIERRLGDIMIISQESIVVDIKVKKYTTFLKGLAMQMNGLLDRTLPRDIVAPLEASKLKIDVAVACAALGQIIAAFSVFHTQISRLKTHILAVNTEFTHLNTALNLPFAVILTLEELPVSPLAA